jgi:photosystem II stability/assembly factor-like uncharacterized protein
MKKDYRLLFQITFGILFTVSSTEVFAQWKQITIPTTEDLCMVRFASETTGWVVGSNFVYKTTDGGSNWQIQDTISLSATHCGCEALFVVDSLIAIYADYSTMRGIRRTSDGGYTWQTVDNSNFYYADFKFVNKKLGFAACGSPPSYDSGVVRKTIDGGLNWNTIASIFLPNGGGFAGISFVDSLSGWAVTSKGRVYHSTDGGFSWKFQDSVGRSNFPLRSYLPCTDIQFTSLDSGWVVGGVGVEPVMARTTNGGKTWVRDDISQFSRSSLYEIHMVNSQIGWFVGMFYGPTLAKTTDGGLTWSDQLPVHDNLASISMVNENVGYTVGRSGRVYKTENSGVTSVFENNPTTPQQFELSQNYPNPFNPSTKISWQSPVSSWQALKIYDILGNEVAALVDEFKSAGSYEVEFDASSGIHNLASGIYFYQLKVGDFIETKKMVLIR